MSEEVPETKDLVTEESNEGTARKRPFARILGIILIAVAVLAAWLLLVSFLGYQSGQQLLTEKQEAEYVAAINRQIELARTDLTEEKFELALVRLEWVLEREPNNQDALALQAEVEGARTAVQTAPTPSSTAATATPPPAEEVSEEALDSPGQELQRIRSLVATKAWSEALSALHAFQLASPNYERPETDRLLYQIYSDYGLELMNNGQVELGLNYLTQAEKLGDLPQTLDDYRLWGALYTQGISYYGVNWELSATFFRDLCLSAPFFQNSCDKLFTILMNLAELYAANEDWCPALSYYEEASFQQTSAELNGKIGYAREMCLQATVTPSEPISGTVPITDTGQFPPITDTQQLPPVELPTEQP